MKSGEVGQAFGVQVLFRCVGRAVGPLGQDDLDYENNLLIYIA
jgi:hypothetical protein